MVGWCAMVKRAENSSGAGKYTENPDYGKKNMRRSGGKSARAHVSQRFEVNEHLDLGDAAR